MWLKKLSKVWINKIGLIICNYIYPIPYIYQVITYIADSTLCFGNNIKRNALYKYYEHTYIYMFFCSYSERENKYINIFVKLMNIFLKENQTKTAKKSNRNIRIHCTIFHLIIHFSLLCKSLWQTIVFQIFQMQGFTAKILKIELNNFRTIATRNLTFKCTIYENENWNLSRSDSQFCNVTAGSQRTALLRKHRR